MVLCLSMDFSVIMPACNEEKVIANSLRAVINQKSDKELIVVCNGCSDRTEKIAKKYASVISIKEKNAALARNLGAKKAKGSILVFMDADIVMEPGCLEEIKKSLEKGVFGSCKVKPDNSKIIARLMCRFRNRFAFLGWATGIIFFKKEVYFNTSGFEEVPTKEANKMIKEARKLGRFVIANCYVVNNMRRYEKIGYIKMILFWIFELINRRSRDYPVIR